MTQKEREQIQKAIDHLNSDNGWEDGMSILAKLVGLQTPIDRLTSSPGYKTMSLIEAMREAREA